jgi:hypothetical protein
MEGDKMLLWGKMGCPELYVLARLLNERWNNKAAHPLLSTVGNKQKLANALTNAKRELVESILKMIR